MGGVRGREGRGKGEKKMERKRERETERYRGITNRGGRAGGVRGRLV